MKIKSITGKITIWYTLFMIIRTACIFGVMIYTGSTRASELAKTKLRDAVRDASDEISASGSDFIIDKDLEFYDDGVYISVYEMDGTLVEGRRPIEVADLPELQDNKLRSLDGDDNEVWYLYDSLFSVDGRQIWVRGIVKDFAQKSTFAFMMRLSFIGFPLLMLIAALGGYIMSKRSFRPVREMTATAEEISRDADLSRRIELDDGHDEIYQLGRTFNSMFDRLEKSFNDEKQFTSDASHELRTPLAVIISQSDYALEDAGYREKALRVINGEARRMSGLVDRLLTFARSDSGRLTMENEDIDLSALCEDIAEQQSYLAEERGVTVEADVQPGIHVTGDETMLIRIILNLTDNAMKYGVAEDGTGTVRLSLNREQCNGAEMVCCSVEDSGPGISQEDMEHIWERFFRADRSRSSEGYGLGLSMVDALVKAHGGHVRAQSVPGEGSCFSFLLPLRSEDAGGKNAAGR